MSCWWVDRICINHDMFFGFFPAGDPISIYQGLNQLCDSVDYSLALASLRICVSYIPAPCTRS